MSTTGARVEGNNRRLVIALGAALGCSLLVIAFLLGRITAKPVAAPAAAERTPAAREPATTAAEPSDSPASAPLPGPAGTALPISIVEAERSYNLEAVPHAGDGSGPGPSAAPVATPPPRSSDQQAVARYFDQIERIGDMGGGDPQGFATSMLQSMSSGDFSGFDALLGKARQQQERLRRLSPPPSCVEHLRLAQTLSADSVAMLERLKAALVRGDASALMAMATEGRELEAQANQLKALGETIRRTAGL